MVDTRCISINWNRWNLLCEMENEMHYGVTVKVHPFLLPRTEVRGNSPDMITRQIKSCKELIENLVLDVVHCSGNTSGAKAPQATAS